ncbi:MAG: diphthine--ammonia ligase [Nanoarchaeota archaeon]|nr:diphthine--ammonia ligase [Nanoarchaeota archaeon]
MCGIVGIFNKEGCGSDITAALEILKHRGRDGFGVFSEKGHSYKKSIKELKIPHINVIAHCLHSIVNKVNQPIKKQGILSSNCEIYNWKELKKKYDLGSGNDSELLIDIIESIGLEKSLEEIDGVYAFAYWSNNRIFLVRDIIGIKPIWFSYEKSFAFASEKKALERIGYKKIEELNPRKILIYDIKTKKLVKKRREFFRIGKLKEDYDEIICHTQKLIMKSIEKRLPDKKFGILFSGGIDSTFLAYICKKLGKDFICYTAALEEKGMEEAPDSIYAKKVAKKLGLKLKIKKINIEQTKEYLKIVPKLIEDSNVTKVGVALTFFVACELAKKDNIKVIFSGLGSEEIFAGYERHKKSSDINKECFSGLIKMYERDLYRDDVITMYNNMELRVPFLDKSLVEYCLKIPEDLKLKEDRNKIIIREIAKKIGIPEEFAERKKKAAQYGSKFDRAIEKLAKKDGFRKKSEFLYQFYHPPNVKLGVLWSSGKDSAFAAYTMKKQNYDMNCLISLKSRNPDSYMFHTPNIDLVELQAKAIGIPLIIQKTKGEKEKELNDLKKAIKKAKELYKIEGIVTGALFSNYQRERIERICDELELKIFSPLWHLDQESEMRDIIKNKFSIIFSSIAAYGLDKTWLGKTITDKDIDKLVELNKKYQINIAGEGGEFESLVLDCPLFKKKINIIDSEIIEENQNTAKLIIKKAELKLI